MVFVKLLSHVLDALRTLLHMAVGLPALLLPQRFWAQRLDGHSQTVRLVLVLLPWALLGAVVGLSHYTFLVQAHPSMLPETMFGLPRVHIATLVRIYRTDFFAAKHLWMHVWVAVVLALDTALPSVTALVTGAVVWVAILLCSTCLLAPLHWLAMEPSLRRRLGQPLEGVIGKLLVASNNVWRQLAQRRAWWFVGTAGGGMPLFVPVTQRQQTWVLGGSDRKSNATPMMLALRAAILASRPVLLIDTLASVALAEQLRAYAAEAKRLPAFRSLTLEPAPLAEDEQEIFSKAHRSGGILYVGLPLQRQDHDEVARARSLLQNLIAAIPATVPRQGPLVIGLQDAAELPPEELAVLLRQAGAQIVLAQQRCDAAAMSLPAQQNKSASMLVLAPARKQDALVLAQALGRGGAKNAVTLTANMVRELRWREGVYLQDGAVVQGLVRLDNVPKRGAAPESAPGDAALN